MAGGSPLEEFNIFGAKVPRYKVAGFTMLAYVGIAGAISVYNSFKPKAPVSYSSKEEENYVQRYLAHVEKQSHKPELLRTPYTGPASL